MKAHAENVVPIAELKALRDYLYENDLIFMKGLSKLNELIRKYEVTSTWLSRKYLI